MNAQEYFNTFTNINNTCDPEDVRPLVATTEMIEYYADQIFEIEDEQLSFEECMALSTAMMEFAK